MNTQLQNRVKKSSFVADMLFVISGIVSLFVHCVFSVAVGVVVAVVEIVEIVDENMLWQQG